MVTRLILSLKRVAHSPDPVRVLGGAVQLGHVTLPHRTIGGTERGSGDIALKHLSSEREVVYPGAMTCKPGP